MKKQIIAISCVLLSCSCSFQPNNSDGIILMKKTDDTLVLSIVDSYYVIKKYNIAEKKDTLFIDIQSVSSPNIEDRINPTLIHISSNVNYIKLQNDSIIDVIRIPFYN